MSQGSTQFCWGARGNVLSDFQIVSMLGTGGMGEVYLVQSLSTGCRFAAKRMKGELFQDPLSRRRFMEELLVWMDLPIHPNITPCCFFRTVDDSIFIFAAFVDGGSLNDWMAMTDAQTPRLYHGTQEQVLERVLDIAVRTARGLQVIHEQHVIHQDIKPNNILITKEGKPRITDFGLARACDKMVAEHGTVPAREGKISCGGMTPAYCSPEQVRKEPLTFRTDIWSWGVSVLEMFTGQVTWTLGTVANEALDDYLEMEPKEEYLPRMPAAIANVLRKCFRQDPDERWKSLAEASQVLMIAYYSELGRSFDCGMDRPKIIPFPANYSRSTFLGIRKTWENPFVRVKQSLEFAGKDPAQADSLILHCEGSRKARMVADLVGYDAALQIQDALSLAGLAPMDSQLAVLCLEKAVLHECLGDFQGAMMLCERAITSLDSIEADRQMNTKLVLALSYREKGFVFDQFWQHAEAVAAYDRAIEILQYLDVADTNTEIAAAMIDTYILKAISLGRTNDSASREIGEKVCDDAICMLKSWMQNNASHRLNELVADCLLAKAGNVDPRSRSFAMVEAMRIYQTLQQDVVVMCKRRDCFEHASNAVFAMGNTDGGLVLWEKAKDKTEQVVYEKGWSEYAINLAVCYGNGGCGFQRAGRMKEALAMHNASVELFEQLVNWEGRYDLRRRMALERINRSYLLLHLGQRQPAIIDADIGVAILKDEMARTGHQDLIGPLKKGYEVQQALRCV